MLTSARSARLAAVTLGIPLAATLAAFVPAHAVMDIGNEGPSLRAGGFVMRVTNVGAVGNAFFDAGLSNDASFEFPAYSGVECLHYASLWVGARDADGVERVSGGPLLEWRPTLAEDDRVRERRRDELSWHRLYDDDGDGRDDEEVLNARDDDGDGRIDEDLGLAGDQSLVAEYRDDETAAVVHTYPDGEAHVPLGLSVRQESFAWERVGYEGIAGVRFTVTNHSVQTLRDVHLGFYADLDVRLRGDRAGHLNDRIEPRREQIQVAEGHSSVTAGAFWFGRECLATLSADYAVLRDGRPGAALPFVTALPLDHTTDPLAGIPAAARYARAPRARSFRTTILTARGQRSTGSVPVFDSERYAALAGSYPAAAPAGESDYSVLLGCGPFPILAPGQSIDFDVALVAASSLEQLGQKVRAALMLHHGQEINALPDSIPESERNQYRTGATGTFGHEVCLEPPEGESFVFDPHCPSRFTSASGDLNLPDTRVLYEHGQCVWTDADCNPCTPGTSGAETRLRWHDVGAAPPLPGLRLVPGEHAVTIEWDNLPEVLLAGGALGTPESRFLGYRLYKIADWRGRIATFPENEQWTLIAAFSRDPADTGRGQIPLGAATDSSVAPVEILYEQPRYPVGRYRHVDREVLDGFHYAYLVTATYEFAQTLPLGRLRRFRLQSPLAVTSTNVVVPHRAARDRPGVWVVPNPYRVRADWDRPPILHDALGHHLDFMGLPRALSTIRIYTLSGDFVQEIVHDGRGGDGQAAWNLVSRSGQDVASGIYLYTVESAIGHETGRFVIIR